MLTHVTLVSENKKTGPMAAVYRTQDSCPTSCPLMGNGCYAEVGPGGGAFAMVGRYGSAELDALRALRFQIPKHGWLRLNVSGDFLAADGSPDMEYIDACNELVRRRPDINVLAYTHEWRALPKELFSFTVNASCETAADIEEAVAAGWQTVLADSGGEDSLIGQRIGGVPVVRCPAEIRDGMQCVRCGACSVDTRTRPTIAFVAHGSRRKVAERVIRASRARSEATEVTQ